MLFHYFFMIASTSVLLRNTTENINHTTKPNILFTKQLYCTVVCFSVTYDFRHNQYASGRSTASMMQLLLLLSGIESNPGPTKYPCGECNKPVCYRRSIACENCNKWYHKSCIEMCTIVYDCYTENSKLEWEFCNCVIKNISFPLFNHPVDSDHLLSSSICSSSPNITTKKAKQLRIITINFQSVWGKKEELELALVENNMDVVIGCKTHLDPCIHDSEFLPLNYTCFWTDRKDGWGGVIIIIKNELINS